MSDIADIMSKKPEDADHYIDKLYAEMKKSTQPRQTVTFIQFADTHMDPLYQEGAEADCGGNYCCRKESDSGKGTIKAGKFGTKHGRCDVPSVTVESVLD